MEITDVHNHLQFPVFHGREREVIEDCAKQGISRMVVNGTQEKDWDHVLSLARDFPHTLIPACGLHPWWIKERSDDWDVRLNTILEKNPNVMIGECGIDYWIDNYDAEDQEKVFARHLELALAWDRPIMIHCLRAWEPLLAILRKYPCPEKFLLHAYGGPAAMVETFSRMGAYFSFAPNLCDPRRTKNHASAKAIPEDRLLLESDAPDMLPPEAFIRKPLYNADGNMTNHPLNLLSTLGVLSEFRGVDALSLAAQISRNAKSFLGEKLF